MSKKLFLFCCVFFHLSFHALADLEKARDLMEANQFEQAMEELIPAARSGNAEAEELIGVCLLYTSPSPRDGLLSRMPSSA